MACFTAKRNQLGVLSDLGDNALNDFTYYLHDNLVPGDPLEIFLNSNGGPVCNMVTMLSLIRTYREKGCVRTIGSGWVTSCAVPLLAAGSRGERYVLGRDTRLMVHEISATEIRKNIPHSELEIELAVIREGMDTYYRMLAAGSGKPEKFWREKIHKQGNVYFSPEEAVEWGLADKVVDVMPPAFKEKVPVKA